MSFIYSNIFELGGGVQKKTSDSQEQLSLSQNLSTCEQAGTGNPTLTTADNGKCV